MAFLHFSPLISSFLFTTNNSPQVSLIGDAQWLEYTLDRPTSTDLDLAISQSRWHQPRSSIQTVISFSPSQVFLQRMQSPRRTQSLLGRDPNRIGQTLDPTSPFTESTDRLRQTYQDFPESSRCSHAGLGQAHVASKPSVQGHVDPLIFRRRSSPKEWQSRDTTAWWWSRYFHYPLGHHSRKRTSRTSCYRFGDVHNTCSRHR